MSDPLECPHARECGGCSAIERPYDAQLAVKRERLSHALGRYPALANCAVDAVRGAEPRTDYRTRAKLVAGRGGALGLFHRDGDHRVVDIPGCRVLAPALAETVVAIRALMHERPGAFAPCITPTADGGRLRSVDLREVRSESGAASVMATFVIEGDDAGAVSLAAALCARVPAVVTVATSSVQHKARVIGSAPRVIRGLAVLPDRVAAGVDVLAVPGGFVQAHRAQAERAIGEIAQGLSRALGDLRAMRVLDVYAGSGAIGLALAAQGAVVECIESFAPAAARIAEAASRCGLPVRTHADDAARALASWPRDPRVDAVVLNPPRRGVSPAVRTAIARIAPRAIAYLSCEPETLARDLDHFATLGFGVVSITPFDFMPQTVEVETLVFLRREAPRAATVLLRERELLGVEKAPHAPLGDALRGLHWIDRLADDESGAMLGARSSETCAQWRAALDARDAVVEAVALVRGITHDHGRIRRPVRVDGHSMDAVTRYRRARVVAGHSLLELSVERGRFAQLRTHLAGIGHPVLGDERLGHAPSNRHLAERVGLDRPFVHRTRIELACEDAAGRITVVSPLAPDLAAVLARLEGSVRSAANAPE